MDYSKPGCFGNAVTYNNRSKACQECEFNDSCSLKARQRIEELRQMVSVDSILKLAHKPPEKPKSTLPEKAQATVAKMNSLQQKTVGVLMTLDQPTPVILIETLMQRLNLSRSDAIMAAKGTVSSLVKDCLATVADGRITLRF